MTRRLYLNDSYVCACDALVTACEPADGGFLVELDQTVFFPTGGGQPHDTGSINKLPVRDVFEEGERVWHLVGEAIPVGQAVHCEIDWPRRFDFMQQHSGEHILSFAAHALFGAKNVGFHMAETYCTVDFDIPFSPEEIAALEIKINELVTSNAPVTLSYVDAAELENLTLRKEAKGLTGEVRIVYMHDGDSCTCCGTHVNHTGEVGCVKITAAEHYKGGERMWFACGGRALSYFQHIQEVVDALARSYSCKAEDVPGAVKKTQQELASSKRECNSLYTRLGAYIAEELRAGAEEIKGARLIVTTVDLPVSRLRPLALALTKEEKTLALLCAKENDTLSYVLCASENLGLDMGELAPAINAALNARGGGRGALAQGSAKCTKGLEEALEQLQNYLAQRLKAR